MRRAVVVAALLLFLTACGSAAKLGTSTTAPPSGPPSAIASPSPGASPMPSAAPSPSATATPIPGAHLPAGFSDTDFSGGSDSTGSAVLAVRVAAHDGYDRFVIEFAGTIPGYAVTRQSSAIFTLSPKGTTEQLEGTAGVLVRLHPVADWASYRAATSFHPGLAYLREARQMENFEAVQQWGLGIAGRPALRVLTLASPSRLVVDVTTA